MSKTFSGYKLEGRKKFQGLDISIENERGSVRRGTDSNGHEWASFMHIPYGYIRATEGVDGDHVDCYIGANPHSTHVFIIHQQNPETKAYDEDKVMLGFNTASDARKSYTRQYDRPGYFQSMDSVDMDTFKDMLKNKYGMKLKKSMPSESAESSVDDDDEDDDVKPVQSDADREIENEKRKDARPKKFTKAKPASVGSISKDGKHVKAGKGKWVRIPKTDPRYRGADKRNKSVPREAPKKNIKSDLKPTGFKVDIEEETIRNNNFRKVIATGAESQLVLMSLKPGEEIGMEIHPTIDQFFRIDKGSGEAIIGGKSRDIKDGDAFIVPKGVEHNVIAGPKGLKLYTIYSPPNHKEGTVEKENMEKAKRAPIGAISKDGTRKKAAEGKWVPVVKVTGGIQLPDMSKYAITERVRSEIDVAPKMFQPEAKYKVTKRWISGPKAGTTSTEGSISKPRVGRVISGAWGGKYKVLKVEVVEIEKSTPDTMPVIKQVHRKGKTFNMRYWVSTKKPSEIRERRDVVEDVPVQHKYHVAPRSTAYLMELQNAVDFAPDSNLGVDKIKALQQIMYGDHTPSVEDMRETAAQELEWALKAEGKDTGRGWYAEKIQQTRNTLVDVWPDLANDKEWAFFVSILSLTSPMNPVAMNMKYATQIYDTYKKTGRIPIKQSSGKAWPGPDTVRVLSDVQKKVDEMGMEGFADWMMQGSIGREIKKMNPSFRGRVTIFHPNAMRYGPKVGAFFNNMMGEHSFATIDMWAIRAWRRWSNDIKKVKNSKGALVVDVKMDSPIEKANVKSMFDSLAEEFDMDTADVQAVLWYYEKRLYKQIGAESPGSEDIGFDEAAKRVYDAIAR